MKNRPAPLMCPAMMILILSLLAVSSSWRIGPATQFGNPRFAQRVKSRRLTLSKVLAMTAQANDGTGLSVVEDEKDIFRKWFTIQFQKRAEVVLSDATTVSAAVIDFWKSILVSVRVLEKDKTLHEHVSILALTKYGLDKRNVDSELKRFQSIVDSINADQTSLLFQPNFKRNLKVLLKPPLGDSSLASIVVLVDTKRIAPETADEILEDMDDFVPPVEDALTNNIESFPFPTVYDFISEVNRPPDPLTLSQLTFNYKVTDFKYDLTKMAKKKNPQDVLKSINCKLTRLQKWKEVLSQPNKNDLSDPFVEPAEWGEEVKRKYQSLKALTKADTKKALDTQYDKRATFIKIIDQWSDRLKRSFKFTYFASRRPPEDFQKAIMESQWRNEMLNTTRLLGLAPFLNFGGPNFQPGFPDPLFRDDRYIMYESGYDVELILYEMLAWFKNVAAAEQIISTSTFSSIIQHTYSRGLITERVMFDVWQGLHHWTHKLKSKTPVMNAKVLVSQLSATKGTVVEDLDHTDAFLKSLRAINFLSRETSMEKRSSIKEMFKTFYQDGIGLSDWWTTLVRDLDLTDQIDAVAKDRDVSWSTIVDDVIKDENLKEGRGIEGGLDAATAAKAAEQNALLWKEKYRETLSFAEKIADSFPWTAQPNESPSADALSVFAQQVRLNDETVTLDFEREMEGESSYLFVAPRFFRGIGGDQDLGAFLEFVKLVTAQIRSGTMLGDETSNKIDVVATHPRLINQEGQPEFGLRSPHPAILFTIRSS